jgi:magnesium chelatase family protein
MGEFPTVVLDALRQPLEEGQIRVSRARGSTTFPARFIMVGAMNPCPCGDGGAPGACRCSESARERYARRLSGPLLDRFDIAIRVDPPQVDELMGGSRAEPTALVAGRVARARRSAAERGVTVNAEIAGSELDRMIPLDSAATTLVERQVRRGALSARGLHRIRRLAGTIADLDGVEGPVGEPQIREALVLRCQRALLLGTECR